LLLIANKQMFLKNMQTANFLIGNNWVIENRGLYFI